MPNYRKHLSQFKTLKLVIDNHEIVSSEIEIPSAAINPDDLLCQACGGYDVELVAQVIQYALEGSRCCDVFRCHQCNQVYHVQYDTEFWPVAFGIGITSSD